MVQAFRDRGHKGLKARPTVSDMLLTTASET